MRAPIILNPPYNTMHAMYALKREDGTLSEVSPSLVQICARGPRVTRDENERMVIPSSRTKLVRVLVVEYPPALPPDAWDDEEQHPLFLTGTLAAGINKKEALAMAIHPRKSCMPEQVVGRSNTLAPSIESVSCEVDS